MEGVPSGRLFLGLFPLSAFVYHINGPFSALLRSPQYLIIEYLYTSGMRKLENLASYEDDSFSSFSQDLNSSDDLGFFDSLFSFSWLPSFSDSGAGNDSAVQLFGAETNLSNTSYPLVEPASPNPEFTPIEAPLLNAGYSSYSDPKIASPLADDFSIEGLYLMLLGLFLVAVFNLCSYKSVLRLYMLVLWIASGYALDFLVSLVLPLESQSSSAPLPAVSEVSELGAGPLGALEPTGLAARTALPAASSAPPPPASHSPASTSQNLISVVLLLAVPLFGFLASRLHCRLRYPFKFFTTPGESDSESDLSRSMCICSLDFARSVLSFVEDYFPLIANMLYLLALLAARFSFVGTGPVHWLYSSAYYACGFFGAVLLVEFLLCVAIDAYTARRLFRASVRVSGTMRTMMDVIRRFRHIDQLFYSWSFYFVSTLVVLVLSYNRVALGFPFADEELLRFYEDCLKKLLRSSTFTASNGASGGSANMHTLSPPMWRSLAGDSNVSEPPEVFDYRNVSVNASNLMQLFFGSRRHMNGSSSGTQEEAAMLQLLGPFNMSAFAALVSIAACCSSPMSLLGFCIALSRLSCALLQGVHCFVYWRAPGAARRMMHAQLELNLANEGLSEGILMFILALNSNLIELELAERFLLLPVIMFVLTGSFLHSVLEIVADTLQRLPATTNHELLAHFRPLGIALLLVLLPPLLILKLVAVYGYELDFWTLIFGASCIFVTIEALQAMLTYALLTFDVLVRPLVYIDEWLLGIRCATGALDFLITIASICLCLHDMATNGLSYMTILIIGLHFYTNVWLRIQSAWKALKRRRDASNIIAALAPVTEAELHDICAICQQDLSAPSDLAGPSSTSVPSPAHSDGPHTPGPESDSADANRDDLALHGEEIGAPPPSAATAPAAATTTTSSSTSSSPTSSSSEPERAADRSPIVPHVRRTACRHYFHISCLRKWLHIRAACPLCHTQLQAAPSKASESNQNAPPRPPVPPGPVPPVAPDFAVANAQGPALINRGGFDVHWLAPTPPPPVAPAQQPSAGPPTSTPEQPYAAHAYPYRGRANLVFNVPMGVAGGLSGFTAHTMATTPGSSSTSSASSSAAAAGGLQPRATGGYPYNLRARSPPSDASTSGMISTSTATVPSPSSPIRPSNQHPHSE